MARFSAEKLRRIKKVAPRAAAQGGAKLGRFSIVTRRQNLQSF
jgi:hypothetical protein